MLGKRKLLSICITTLNRDEFLGQILERLSKELDDLKTKNVELIILDDASVDNTKAMCAQYESKFSNIHYYRNPARVGLAPGIHQVSKYATGKYVWYLSDDDDIYRGTLSKIIDMLLKNCDVYYLNIDQYDKNCKVLLKPNLLKLKNRVKLGSKKSFFSHLSSYFPDIFTIDWFTTYLSNLIIRTELIREMDFDIEIYNKDKNHAYFPQLLPIFQSRRELSFYLAKESVVKFRSDNASYALDSRLKNYIFMKRIYTHQYFSILKYNKKNINFLFVIFIFIKILFLNTRTLLVRFGI